jgi:hypothetical protein
MSNEATSSNTIRVLLVDDHDILRQGLKMLLSMQKEMQVVGEARTGREALVMSQKLLPDVVVMDITMPDMDGLEACQLIRIFDPSIRRTRGSERLKPRQGNTSFDSSRSGGAQVGSRRTYKPGNCGSIDVEH